MPTFTFDTYVERFRRNGCSYEYPVSVTYTCDAAGNVDSMSAAGDDGDDLLPFEWDYIDDEIADRIDDDLADWLADQDGDDSLPTASESTIPPIGVA